MMMMMTMRVSSFVLLALLSTMGSNGLEQQQGKCDAGVSAAACAARPEEDDKGTASLPGDDDELDSEEEMQLLQAQKKMQSETKSGRQSELSARTTKKARTGASRAGEVSSPHNYKSITDLLNKMCMKLEREWKEKNLLCGQVTIRRNDTRVACKDEADCATCEAEETACTEGGKIAQDAILTCEEEKTACENNNDNKKTACENEKKACIEDTEKIRQDSLATCANEGCNEADLKDLARREEGACEAEETACNEGKEDCVGKKATCDYQAGAARQDERDACNRKAACENEKAACKNEEETCFQEVDASVDAACEEEETAHNQKVAKCAAISEARAVLDHASLNGR